MVLWHVKQNSMPLYEDENPHIITMQIRSYIGTRDAWIGLEIFPSNAWLRIKSSNHKLVYTSSSVFSNLIHGSDQNQINHIMLLVPFINSITMNQLKVKVQSKVKTKQETILHPFSEPVESLSGSQGCLSQPSCYWAKTGHTLNRAPVSCGTTHTHTYTQ